MERQYCDSVRRFWRGDGGAVSEMGTRLSGSNDHTRKRVVHASINFITAHDGFAARSGELQRKHNEANLEDN